jgi:hypothetical protein
MGGAFESSPPELNQAYPVIDPFQIEQRFLLTRAQLVGFFGAVARHATLELYDRAHPISYTRTTYFDTDDGAYFQSCETPVSRRLRLREYASAASIEQAPTLTGICFLELKQNAGKVRSKVRVAAPPAVLADFLRRQGTFDAHAAGLQDLAALRAIKDELVAGRSVKPRLTTWYRRSCMTAEGGRIRITFDENLTFCQPQHMGAIGEIVGPQDVIAHGPARVLEIKQFGETPDWLLRAITGLNPANNFSKFRVGMTAMRQRGAEPDVPVAVGVERTLTPTTSPGLFVLTGDGA